MKRIYFPAIILLLLISQRTLRAQACDSVKECTGKALTISVTSGKGAQWVDVDSSFRIRNIDTALTFEAWLKPIQQPGKRVYIGGIWGPNKDHNDVWVAYLVDTKIYFVLSSPTTFLGDADNTVIIANIPNLYSQGWVHLALIWDGVSQEGRILVNGFEMARGGNAAYPISKLHHQEDPKLNFEIGSCNGLYDDTLTNRTFRGQMDEVRLWSRALSNNEVRCQLNKSLDGNENQLELYYRFNDSSKYQTLCDASTHGHSGIERSGATKLSSDRTVPVTFTLTPNTLTASLICVDDSVFTFTLLDTSFCGNSLAGFVYGGYASLFTLNQTSYNTQQNVPITFTVRFKGNLTGSLYTYLYIVNTNRCGDYLQIPIVVNRATELQYSKSAIVFDTLLVGCIEKTYTEDTLRICNQSNRPLQITKITNANGKFSWNPAPTFSNLPLTLQPGECWKIVVRMDANDTTKTLYDTLRITSDDKCPGSGFIPLEGRTQDVFVLLTPSAKSQIHNMAFEAVCPGQLSNVQDYQFRSLMTDNVYIDTITFSVPEFFGRKFTFPILMKPKTAYTPEFIRFRPSAPGPFVGQARVVSHYRGCTITKTIDLTGSGISVDVAFTTPNVLFGKVSIGKNSTLQAIAKNNGVDPRNMSSYLKVGDVFTIVAGKTFGLGPGNSANISVNFRPREPKIYYDTLCIFDLQCYGTICIPISGEGVFEQLRFDSSFLNIANVIGCECRTDSIKVTNISGVPVNVLSDALNDVTGNYTLLNRAPTGNLADKGSFIYRVQYCPNDINNDRADRSYITINLSGGETYQILLQGSSMVPKLAVTPLTTYGPIEVGWQKDDSITIENISAVPVHITTVNTPAGFALLSVNPPLPFWLAPRDSITAIVRFTPTAGQNYIGNVTVTLDTPCGKKTTGVVSGSGVVLELDVPVQLINYGLVRPCDCQKREIPLSNRSNFNTMTIDSVWIDALGIPSPNATVFSWVSKRTGSTSGSFTIPPNTEDTLLITFCPNIPAVVKNLTMNAQIHIDAHGAGWTKKFVTFLSGRREMNFQPNNVFVQFPNTRVDVNAAPMRVSITVPDAFTNPSGDSIIFTSAVFVPDQRVFTVTECTGKPLPWVVRRGETLCLNIDFLPRAPKVYSARLNLFTSFPCDGVDTSIFVTGSGFAPAYGEGMAFDTSKINQDTFHITSCDTLVIPIMITRDIPQNIIDMLFHLGYDTTKLSYLNIQSPYTNQATVLDSAGVWANMKNARNVAAGTVCYVRFIPKGDTANFVMTLDNIDFDSDSIVFFKFTVNEDHAQIIIDNPKIAIQQLTDFDTVLVKQCKDLLCVVRNTGLVPMRFDSLASLPAFHSVVGSDKPYPLLMQPGDSIVLTIRFCPRADSLIDTSIFAFSNLPCPIIDTGRVHSYGFAPPYPFTLSFDPRIGIVDTVSGIIGDTVTVPILMNVDMPLTPIDMRYVLSYDKYAIQYISAVSKYGTPTVVTQPGFLSIELDKCDSVTAGVITQLKFLLNVPDSVVSSIVLTPGRFTSDSILFIKPIPTGDTTAVKIDPKCRISYLVFKAGQNSFVDPRPNPTTGRVETEVEFFEDVAPKLTIFGSTGSKVMDVL
ncbi:MAG: choice-of-anchor D domain-containing protein, partial [Ignavibacteriota bacterium]